MRFQRIHSAPPRRARRPQPQQFPQLVKFQNVLRLRDIVLPALLRGIPKRRQTVRRQKLRRFRSEYCTLIADFPFAFAPRRWCPTLPLRAPAPESAPRNRPAPRTASPAITDLFSISQTTANSTSVPVPPLQAQTVAERINSKSRSSQVFMRTSTSIHALALRSGEKVRGHSVRFSAGFFRAARTASITPP